MNEPEITAEMIDDACKCISCPSCAMSKHPDVAGSTDSCRRVIAQALKAEKAKDKTEVGDIPCVETTCEYFDNQMPDNCGGERSGEPALCTCVKYLKSSKLITDFIQSRQEKPIEFCEYSKEITAAGEVFISSCGTYLLDFENYCTHCGKPIKLKE